MMMLTARVEPTLDGVRTQLQPPRKTVSYLSVLGAAAFAALSALGLASSVILGPPGLAHAAPAAGTEAARLP